MSEIKDPSVAMYEVYIACVRILLLVCEIFLFLPSLRCPFLCTRLMCWCFLIDLAEIISTTLTDLHHCTVALSMNFATF